jgi:hypothetical protein
MLKYTRLEQIIFRQRTTALLIIGYKALNLNNLNNSGALSSTIIPNRLPSAREKEIQHQTFVRVPYVTEFLKFVTS